MSVGRICNREVDTTKPHETAEVAARRMHQRNVGTLVVTDRAGEPMGILTDRDLVVRVLAQGENPSKVNVEAVMTKGPLCLSEGASIEEALGAMRSGPYRRLPVVDAAGKLTGVLSLDDVLKLLSEEFSLISTLVDREGPAVLSRR